MGITSSARPGRVERRRTTLALPVALLEAIDREVEAGAAESRAALVAEALEREMRRRREMEIDRAFYELANDPELAEEERELHAAFAGADRESWMALNETDGGWDE